MKKINVSAKVFLGRLVILEIIFEVVIVWDFGSIVYKEWDWGIVDGEQFDSSFVYF